MMQDDIFAAVLKTLISMSAVHRNLAMGGQRGYNIDNMMAQLETMMGKQIEFLVKQEGQVTKQETSNNDDIPF